MEYMEHSDKEIVIERVMSAKRETIWKAWTEQERVAKWWGPNGFKNTFKEFAVEPGGVWDFVMRGPDGEEYPNTIIFKEVVEPERLVYSHGGSRDLGLEDFTSKVTFEEVEPKKTKVTMRAMFVSAEERGKQEVFGAVEGGQQTLARLAAFVE